MNRFEKIKEMKFDAMVELFSEYTETLPECQDCPIVDYCGDYADSRGKLFLGCKDTWKSYLESEE